MPGTVNQYQQTAFVDPQNGQSGDASVVLSNDNATRGKHNQHDADTTIHIQSSDLAGRPAAGTPQRAWWTTDEFRLYFDFAGVWNPLKVRAEDVIAGTFGAGNYAITGNLAVSGTITGNVTGDLTGNVTGNVSGNAGTATLAAAATVLAASRTLWGKSFNGSANVAGAIEIVQGTYAAGDGLKATNGSVDMTLGLVSAGGNVELELTGNGATFTHKIKFTIGGSPATREAIRFSGNLGVGATYVEIMEHLGSFQRIYIGDPDSGGTGYRMLRVLNFT